jgi:hypothetical protein
MVQPHPVHQVAADGAAKGAVEAKAPNRLVDGFLFLLAAVVHTHQRLGLLRGLVLRKMDHIQGCFALAHQGADGFVGRRLQVGEFQGHRAMRPAHLGHLLLAAGFQILPDLRGVSEGGRHQQEGGSGQGEQGNLP